MDYKRQSQIKLAQLHILLVVAECHSFSEAALHLEMSQSSVSSAIASLESDLGIVLFTRGRHGAQLTPVGDRIAAHARQIMQWEEEIIKEANLARSLQGGEVRISAFRSVSTHVLPGVIAQFQHRFPDVAIKIAEYFDDETIEEDLRRGRADIGFTERLLGEEFDTWELLRDEYVVLLPSTYDASHQTLSWDQISRYPLIMATDGDSCDAQVYAHCAAHGKGLHVTYQVKADSTIVNMVAQGLGATIIPRLAAEPIPATVHVYPLPVPLFRVIYTAVLANALHSPGVYAFLDLLKNVRRK